MAESENHFTPSSGNTSDSSTPVTGIQQSQRVLTKEQKQRSKVKFSDLADEEEQDGLRETFAEPGGRADVPEIRLSESEDVADLSLTASSWAGRTGAAAAEAQDRASRLHNRLSDALLPQKQHAGSKVPHIITPQTLISPNSSPPTKPVSDWPVKLDEIPLESLGKDKRPYMILEDSTDDDDSDEDDPKTLKPGRENYHEAKQLLRTITGRDQSTWRRPPRSGTETPAVDKQLHDMDYVPPPVDYRPSPIALIHKLTALKHSGYTGPAYRDDPGSPPSGKHSPRGYHSRDHSRNGSDIHEYSITSSGRVTPKRPKWYDKGESEHQSSGSLGTLLATTVASASTATPEARNHVPRPGYHRERSSQGMIATAVDMIKHPTNYFHPKSSSSTLADEERVVLDVAEIIACRKYLKKLARSLMAVGAPSHRLEQYMNTSARALSIDAEFLYLPGSMLVSINDKLTMSTEVTLVRESGGVDLGKFKDVFDVYKLVIHGKYTAEEGTRDLGEIMQKSGRHSLALRIVAYGIAAISVGPFAFSARPVDFAPNFILGATLGFLQLVVVTKSEQFSHVFEVLAAVLIAFVSRGLGSIYHDGSPIFCFSAIAQSSIALILPGYTVLCAALELQSKSLVSGSVRMVYAIIYSLFLGFGILVGDVVMGLIYPQAQSDVTCRIPTWWNDSNHGPRLIYARFVWVPIFATCLAIINQAKWKQIPVMTGIAFIGYQSNFWVSTKLANNIQVANGIGAFAVGTLANLYSRFFHGLAAAAMLPAIFVQVPSGLAASGSLVAGITSANQITGNATGVSVINNGTAGFLDAQNSTMNADVYSGTIFNVGYGMVQVAIGISVGLYLSALVVYPFGKRRSGLFSL
ncbi:hypothetical protein A1O7_09218 [Cladophialophora yegresii CBS 114405]|uniref:Threonine/serine exporter-like N-terminal domain-containing protein n=1 Tax=Cladophialophora yegresii CBS 114405 TaxID=1182544 RepID=W9VE62_9EURO|nr:uncharacterized protein A1O7_09218 [Cladophialophora yegresii CBS 114405]EXJ53882.1 hypothetical protein A1O7_09218 [Cladophialophora yegresii CBS 114405]